MKITVTKDLSDDLKEMIHQKVQEYNKTYFEAAGFKNFGIYIKNDQEEMKAGLAGILRGDWLLIQSLWVSSELRHRNIGSELLKRAESEARDSGCKHVLLDTFEFQAPLFYKKYGYKEVFVYQEHPITGNHYYLAKDL